MPEGAGEANGREQVEAVRHIVRAVLAEEKQASRADREAEGWLSRLIRTWQFFAAVLALGVVFAAWLTLDVTPLDPYKEIKQRKQQHAYQQELAARHVKLGSDFLSVGQPKAAEAEFTHAKELDTYNVDADLGLLKVSVFEPVFEKEYDPEITERRIQDILDHNEGDTHALAVLGIVYSRIDPNPQVALKYYDKALASNSNNAFAYAGKAELALKRGDRQKALALYEKAINISKWNQSFLNNAAYQYYLNGDYKTAQGLYYRLLNLQPDYLLSYSILANTVLMLGDSVRADRILELVDEKLRDQSILKLRRNQGEWMFQVKGQKELVSLYSPEEKVAYLRYILALARQLAGHPTEAGRALREVAADSYDTSRVRLVLDSDISSLEAARPEFARQLRRFRLSVGVKRSFR